MLTMVSFVAPTLPDAFNEFKRRYGRFADIEFSPDELSARRNDTAFRFYSYQADVIMSHRIIAVRPSPGELEALKGRIVPPGEVEVVT